VAHLGDSYHATSPQLGQGANMALLDAAAFAQAVREGGTVAHMTTTYARLRWLHVRLYQSASWMFTPLYQSDSRTLPWLRDAIAAPVSLTWPMPSLLAKLVAGELGGPLRGISPTAS
jgi:2-polyprenyl-6-methoxyphenol hydroxylase-like FAD-dependent oxidoreductase